MPETMLKPITPNTKPKVPTRPPMSAPMTVAPPPKSNLPDLLTLLTAARAQRAPAPAPPPPPPEADMTVPIVVGAGLVAAGLFAAALVSRR
jgi:hypothetical protein